jgi:phosphoribosylaminoimidazole-succinocarboxamide synthase
MREAVLTTSLSGAPKVRTGKVRDVYDLGDSLLIVTTDRISAFDVVMPNGIPDKGRVLTQMTLFWLEHFGDLVPNHLLTAEVAEMPAAVRDDPQADLLRGRSMLVRKAEVMPIECIARGYLVGSGWAEYRKSGTVCGHQLPAGLEQAAKLPSPLFTPSTKADEGHDMNITREQMAGIVGPEVGTQLEELTLRLYSSAADYARERGIIIADTKFEFGQVGGELLLIDEALTPDSSRFWPADAWKTGSNPPSYDKQFVRDYLETLDWNKEPPGPVLPEEVVSRTRAKYVEALERITGRSLDD